MVFTTTGQEDIAASREAVETSPGALVGDGAGRSLRVAATGDVHCCDERAAELRSAFEHVADDADVLLIAGDLTTHGEPRQAAGFAAICAGIEIPVLTVLGNHDWHVDRRDDVIAELAAGGIRVLEGASAQLDLAGHRVGVAGVKGFVGGFSGASALLADFGEPALRKLHRITTHEVQALERALREIERCQIRIVLMHYSPTPQTLVGEPEGVWPFLGSERLAAPIAEHRPDLVLHGHAHAGAAHGTIDGSIPVYNVSMAAMELPYRVFELRASQRQPAASR